MPLPTKVNVSRPRSLGYNALVEYGPTDAESLYLRLAVGPNRSLQFQTVEPEERGPNVAQNPEDMRSESGETFSRSDLSGGEGLRRAYRRDGQPSDATRFYDSEGVDVSPSETGETPKIQLGSTTSQLGSTVGQGAVAQIGGVLYALHESTAGSIRRSTSPTGTPSPSAEATGASPNPVVDLAVIGDQLYAACGSAGTYVRAAGGGWSQYSTQGTTRIWAVKGRIIGFVDFGGSLACYEIRSGGGSVLLLTAPAGHDVADVTDGGTAILIALTSGDIYAFADEDGELVEIAHTNTSPGEQIVALQATLGVALLLTQEIAATTTNRTFRLYVGATTGGRLRELQLLRRWDSVPPYTNHEGHYILPMRDRFAIAIATAVNETEIWYYYLTTGGLVRAFTVPEDDIESMTLIGRRLFLGMDDRVHREELTTYPDDGYLITPLADFYNAAPKAWIGARLQTGAVPTGTQVDLYYSTDPAAIDNPAHSSWTLIITATPSVLGESLEAPILGEESRWVALKVVLTANAANTATPEVLSIAIRGVQLPTEQDYAIPVNISDRLEIPGRKPQTVKGAGDAVYQALQDLVGRAVTVSLLPFQGGEQVKGQIRSVSVPVQEIQQRGSQTVFAQMIVRGQRQ